MQNKLIAAAALSLLVLAPNAARAEGKDGVAAVVNGEEITVEEMKQGYEDNTPIKEQVSFDVFYDKALDVYVNGKLTPVFTAGKKTGIKVDDVLEKADNQ